MFLSKYLIASEALQNANWERRTRTILGSVEMFKAEDFTIDMAG